MDSAPPPIPRSSEPASSPPRTPHRHSHHGSTRHHHHHPRRPAQQQQQQPEALRRRSAPAHHQQHALSNTAAASPEIINSLVDQLSKLQPSPLQNPFLYGSLAPPPAHEPDTFPNTNGIASRDVDYDGGYLHPNDAAAPPVVRTSKPPSGKSSHTNGSGDKKGHSRRSSHHSGISVGKDGVDIPSYVRTYMNRAAAGEPAERRASRDSSVSRGSGSKDGSGRLSCVSSREKIRTEKRAEKERELRANGVGASTGANDLEISIPTRSSSYGKGTPNPGRNSVPEPISTHSAPYHRSPIGSPSFPPPGPAEEEDGEQEAAPAPGLPTAREKDGRKRRSKHYPKRSDSLSTGIAKRSSVDGKVGKQSKESKRKSEPPAGPHTSPTRPSFQASTIDHHERPSSADSIDDAVDAYLCSPRLSQKIRMPTTGRIISFSEVGDPQGFAVFVCVGMGLTRYVTAFYDELALTLGLRLITPDRPGVGESEAVDESERAVLNWPDDVLYICQSLKITKFSILAHSAGAIYALATALRMPGHIRGKIHLLAPWIPPSQMETVVTTDKGEKREKPGSIPTSQRILRALPTPILKAANSSFMSATSSSLTTSLPRTPAAKKSKRKSNTPAPTKVDLAITPNKHLGLSTNTSATNEYPKSVPTSPQSSSPEETPEHLAEISAALEAAEKERQHSYDDRLTSAIWTLSTRNANPAVDLLVCLERNRPVGFRYVDITREVVIHHGARDTRVPVENVKWLGKTMGRCEVRVLEGEGHGLMASAGVMGDVLDEIAKEWRDWRKVVEGRRVEGGGRERRWAE
jgi:pimeloyl-ACP methyl ester carboxylesterase